jgi:tripartite-type tricarboxylate transporter receptor subunit TctC
MMGPRASLLGIVCCALTAGGVAVQTSPNRPMRTASPYASGGGTDCFAHFRA